MHLWSVLPSDVWGEQVVALVQLREGRSKSVDSLKQHCKGLVAGYKVPKQFLFVADVPRTEVGKVDYTKATAHTRMHALHLTVRINAGSALRRGPALRSAPPAR